MKKVFFFFINQITRVSTFFENGFVFEAKLVLCKIAANEEEEKKSRWTEKKRERERQESKVVF